ncbi:hypothetical protein KKC45_02855 [Patescibacteria group bacterium]|nr:hypothetical protein [Patescibacteria group bacterium]
MADKKVEAIVFHSENPKVQSPGLAVINGSITLFNSANPESPTFSTNDLAVLTAGAKTTECSAYLKKHGLDTSALEMLANIG